VFISSGQINNFIVVIVVEHSPPTVLDKPGVLNPITFASDS